MGSLDASINVGVDSSPQDDATPSAAGIINPLEHLANHIMTPGSTYLSPTFLFLVDMSLLFLLFLFISLLVMTRSLHFLALAGITLGLWGSVKLYVSELQKDEQQKAAGTNGLETDDSPSDPKSPTIIVTSESTDSYTPKSKDD